MKTKEFYGFCTKAGLGSPCTFQGNGTEGKTANGVAALRYEPQDCDKVSQKNDGGYPVCFKNAGVGQEWGECAWLTPDPNSENFYGYLLAFDATVQTKDANVSVALKPLAAGFPCAKKDLKKTYEIQPECVGVFGGEAFKKWSENMYNNLVAQKPYVQVDFEGMAGFTKDKNTTYVPACFSKSAADLTGSCGAWFQYRKAQDSTEYEFLMFKP